MLTHSSAETLFTLLLLKTHRWNKSWGALKARHTGFIYYHSLP